MFEGLLCNPQSNPRKEDGLNDTKRDLILFSAELLFTGKFPSPPFSQTPRPTELSVEMENWIRK